jgi:exosortase family protein XrtM
VLFSYPVDAESGMGKSSRLKQSRHAGVPSGMARDALADWRRMRPLLRFTLTFLGLFAAFQLLYYELVVPSEAFQGYLALNSRAAAWCLGLLGDTAATSNEILASRFRMAIKPGCDGLQAMAILGIAVLVFPGGPRRKLWGIAGGVLLIAVLNLVRLVALFLTGSYLPDLFQPMHVHVWPAVLTVTAVAYAVAWAVGPRRGRLVA